MLSVKIIMNSVMEEILAFKCCNISGQNLEMHVHNLGEHTVKVPGRFILESENDTLDCSHLFPPWEQEIDPGGALAFYCSLDPLLWDRYQTLTMFDQDGASYSFPIAEITEYQLPR